EQDISILTEGKPGEIKALITEKDGQIVMQKTCPKHGFFEDVMAIDPAFLRRIEQLYPGSDFKSPKTDLRKHGTSSIKYGRGSVLTVDLTNRCNMMCDPCFMDANQVGYVHELSFDEIKQILDNSLQIKPRRQMSIQFSGGEPTMSPHFIESVRYAKKIGYFSIQAATNGIRFAMSPEFAHEAAEAGMRIAYLQFDGVGNENNQHRKIGNLFDIKLRAIENLAAAGIDVVLVTTIVNTVNDHQVGPIVDFATANADKIQFCAFQPVSFTGRDEDISDEDRVKMRYTLSHLARDVYKATGVEPLRDWFPLSAITSFSDVTDLVRGPSAEWGSLKCGCHPNCGIGTAFLVNKETKQRVPIGEVLDVEQLLKDMRTISDAARGQKLTRAQIALAVLRNYRPENAPKDFSLQDLLTKFDKQSGGSLTAGNVDYGTGHERKKDKWLVMFVAGMWFQDLFNYDFRRTERCIIPYGTQQGEISFCAYNTGIGWRNIIENMHKNATVGEWYKKYGRHNVYADGKAVAMPSFEHSLKLPTHIVTKDAADGNGSGGVQALPSYRPQQKAVGGCGGGCGGH
ncbi:MAG: radical SAM protein, partial [Deltaproteobacteria bacterium]|nr:radical SAM protein [Deltaproteobacteria bacterium]